MSNPNPPWIQLDGTGSRITIQVVPRASKSEIVGTHGDALKVRLQAPPVDGKANKALCSFIAETLKIPSRDVALAVGTTSRHKIIIVQKLAPDAVASTLSALFHS